MNTFKIEKAAARGSSFATPGESYVILASSDALHKHLTDSYWCAAMDEVCDGKLVGVVVRYTGDNLVMLQFRPPKLCPSGYRYPLFMSIPLEFLVPVSASAIVLAGGELLGSFATADSSVESTPSGSPLGNGSPTVQKDSHGLPKLCIVCGRYNVPNMITRRHGWKCKDCKGKKSVTRLKLEAIRLREALKEKD